MLSDLGVLSEMTKVFQMSQESLASSNLPSYETQRNCTPNVLIVGETGVGKSSVINLIAGEQLADVSSGAKGCTLDAKSYDMVLTDSHGHGHHLRLFDTVGLNEPSMSKTDYFTAIQKANALITDLQRTGGIRLLVLCIRGGRITSVTQTNYRLFRDILCQNQVPVAFVITGMENQRPMEGWWNRNKPVFDKSKLLCTSHVCVTATRGLNDVYASQYEESQVAIHRMLLDYLSKSSWRAERRGWFVHLASKLLGWVVNVRDRRLHLPRRSRVLTMDELARHLQDKCRFSREEAMELADKIWAKRMENSDLGTRVKEDDAGYLSDPY